MPFGLNIRKAAYRATFGSSWSHKTLMQYCSKMLGKHSSTVDDLSHINESDSSDSVSSSSSSMGDEDVLAAADLSVHAGKFDRITPALSKPASSKHMISSNKNANDSPIIQLTAPKRSQHFT